MKSIVMPKTEGLNEETIQPREVKETLAVEANKDNKTKFTAIDMWNRNRNSRSASDMMRRWNLN